MYGNSKNVIGMSQSAILHPLVAERELTRTLNPAVPALTLQRGATKTFNERLAHPNSRNLGFR